jgi:hypothetical protein
MGYVEALLQRVRQSLQEVEQEISEKKAKIKEIEEEKKKLEGEIATLEKEKQVLSSILSNYGAPAQAPKAETAETQEVQGAIEEWKDEHDILVEGKAIGRVKVSGKKGEVVVFFSPKSGSLLDRLPSVLEVYKKRGSLLSFSMERKEEVTLIRYEAADEEKEKEVRAKIVYVVAASSEKTQ